MAATTILASLAALAAGALALGMLATGRSIDRMGRPITRSDEPVRFTLSVVAAVAIALIAVLMAAGFVQPT